jgi:hypothetical protein
VQEEYGRRYGHRLEAKFFSPASKGAAEAKQRFREWENEVDARIEAIRVERTGEGIALTPQQARALAGEWYDWFVARHPSRDLQTWDLIRDQLHDALRDAIGDEEWERGNQEEIWREDDELRSEVRPLLADVGETSQFLGVKGLVLNNAARDRFLDWLFDDLWQALRGSYALHRATIAQTSTASAFPALTAWTLVKPHSSYSRRGCSNGSQHAAASRVGVTSSLRW